MLHPRAARSQRSRKIRSGKRREQPDFVALGQGLEYGADVSGRNHHESPVFLDEQRDGSQNSTIRTRSRVPVWVGPLLALFAITAAFAVLTSPSDDANRDDLAQISPTTERSATAPPTTVAPTTMPSTTDLGATESSTTDAPPGSEVPATHEFEPVASAGAHALVGLAPDHYVFLDLRAGELTTVALDDRAIAMAPSENGAIFIFYENKHVEFMQLGDSKGGSLADSVDYFSPSAEPGRVWLGVPQVEGFVLEIDQYGIYYATVDRTGDPGIDPRFRYEPGGGTYQMVGAASELSDTAFSEPRFIGSHVPLATSKEGVVGRICDLDLVCGVEQWLNGGPWRSVAPAARGASVVAKTNPDGTWIAIGEGWITIHRSPFTEDDSEPFVRPDAVDVAFAPSDDIAFLVQAEAVVVIDLESGDTTETSIPPELLSGVEQWIAIARGSRSTP